MSFPSNMIPVKGEVNAIFETPLPFPERPGNENGKQDSSPRLEEPEEDTDPVQPKPDW